MSTLADLERVERELYEYARRPEGANPSECCMQANAVALYVKEQRKREWQPIATAPKDRYILLCDANYKGEYLIAKHDLGGWWSQPTPPGKSIIWREATHWMDLTEPRGGAQ